MEQRDAHAQSDESVHTAALEAYKGGKEKAQHGNTLFVTRLPYSATNTDLSTFFSDIGPLRRAFIVTDRESRQSKGVGYVTYADTTDAERAFEKLQGASIDGGRRHIQLQWADRKAPNQEGRPEKRNADGAPKKAESSRLNLPQRDPDAVRTVVVSGLSGCSPPADTKTLYKRARKIGDVEHVEFLVENGTPSTDVAHIRFRTPNHAMEAVTKLHAHQFKGAQLSVGLKKRLDGAMRLEQHMRPDTLEKHKSMMKKIEKMNGDAWLLNKGSHGLSRESRVIVRNLPFDVTLEDLRAIFLPYGAIYDVTVPTKSAEGEESKKPAKGRGFAFVWFVSRNDAARAMEAVNGVPLRHGAAEQAALKKAQGKKGRTAAKEALEKVHATAQPARPVAVDWSLSQKDWLARGEEAPEAEEEAEEETEAPTSTKRAREEDEEDEEEEEEEEEDDDEDEEDEDDEEDDEEGEEDEDEDEDHVEDEEDDGAPEKARPTMATTETGTILFIRNLPYQATEQELKDLFRSFGPMRYAKITMDPATKRSRGTGFVCFWKRESADAALRDAELVQRETAASSLTDSKLPKVNPFSVPSVITADPSAPLVARFTLHGRVLHVVRAVTREDASHLETAARKSREKKDTRNTWLLREGVPLPNTALSKTLSEKEADKRMQSFSIRRAQLGANPSLHVSKTRLAVHQLPLFVSDKMLKRMALYALRAFTDEVKAGNRDDLDADEKADTTVSANVKQSESDGDKKRPPPSLVIQSKIVRQNERVDPLTGKGRSRGYGFLEMRTFPHALKVLRWANGNKALGDLFAKWWQEELETHIAKLKGAKDISTEDRTRIKRLESTLQDLKDEGQKAIKSEFRGMLRIEFSIENITTVRKRVLRQSQSREKLAKRAKVCNHLTNAYRSKNPSVLHRPRRFAVRDAVLMTVGKSERHTRSNRTSSNVIRSVP